MRNIRKMSARWDLKKSQNIFIQRCRNVLESWDESVADRWPLKGRQDFQNNKTNIWPLSAVTWKTNHFFTWWEEPGNVICFLPPIASLSHFSKITVSWETLPAKNRRRLTVSRRSPTHKSSLISSKNLYPWFFYILIETFILNYLSCQG